MVVRAKQLMTQCDETETQNRTDSPCSLLFFVTSVLSVPEVSKTSLYDAAHVISHQDNPLMETQLKLKPATIRLGARNHYHWATIEIWLVTIMAYTF